MCRHFKYLNIKVNGNTIKLINTRALALEAVANTVKSDIIVLTPVMEYDGV